MSGIAGVIKWGVLVVDVEVERRRAAKNRVSSIVEAAADRHRLVTRWSVEVFDFRR
jgi:hypothetical protein